MFTPRGDVAHDVVGEVHRFDDAPRTGAVLVARREHDAYPGCAARQLFSIRLESTFTRRAFFSSKTFFTCHSVPSAGGVPLFPAAPVSVNVGAVTVQYCDAPPGARPYTWYSVASGTALQATVTDPPGDATDDLRRRFRTADPALPHRPARHHP